MKENEKKKEGMISKKNGGQLRTPHFAELGGRPAAAILDRLGPSRVASFLLFISRSSPDNENPNTRNTHGRSNARVCEQTNKQKNEPIVDKKKRAKNVAGRHFSWQRCRQMAPSTDGQKKGKISQKRWTNGV